MSTHYKKVSFDKLKNLQEENEKNSSGKTLHCKTIAIEKFRHENYIRDLKAHIIDEPPYLLGEDSAPNPSEALLAALGTCISVGIQANLVDRKIDFSKIELNIEGDTDISSVWGTGELKNRIIGFTEIRVKVDLESSLSEDEKNDFMEHILKYSPVTGSLRNNVKVVHIQG